MFAFRFFLKFIMFIIIQNKIIISKSTNETFIEALRCQKYAWPWKFQSRLWANLTSWNWCSDPSRNELLLTISMQFTDAKINIFPPFVRKFIAYSCTTKQNFKHSPFYQPLITTNNTDIYPLKSRPTDFLIKHGRLRLAPNFFFFFSQKKQVTQRRLRCSSWNL